MPTIAIIEGVQVTIYPTLRVTFDGGLNGMLDLSGSIEADAIFAPLKDERYFRMVAVSRYGHSFGWNPDDLGHEIDLCPDATRTRIETALLEEMADRFIAARSAAE